MGDNFHRVIGCRSLPTSLGALGLVWMLVAAPGLGSEEAGNALFEMEEEASHLKKEFEHLLTGHGEGTIVAADFRGHQPRPAMAPSGSLPGGLDLFEPAGPGAVVDRDGFVAALGDLRASLGPDENREVHLKVVGVRMDADPYETDLRYEGWGEREGRRVQQIAKWTAGWKKGDGPAELVSLEVIQFSEVHFRPQAGERALLEDVTAAVLGGQAPAAEQLGRGTNYWRRTLQAAIGIDLFGHQGMAVGDPNGDGLDDIYVCQPGGLPNRLLVQEPDGRVTDRSRAAGLDILDRSRSALFVDYDNDGDEDLSLVTEANLLVMRNDGGLRFTEALRMPIGEVTSQAAADYDLDGDVDLYLCGYAPPTGGANAPVPYHDANNGYRNYLLRNDGTEGERWTFTDVTVESGMDTNNRRYTLAAAWEDHDADGDPDLYVANDFGRNCLYRNDGAKGFTEIAGELGVEDISAGMGAAWGDANGDGLYDIYVSNMYSSAGNRVSYQRRFREGDSEETLGHFRRHARGNTLFVADGSGGFRDESVEAGVTMGRWAWSSLFADLNLDGWEDLLVTNGLVTNPDLDDL